MARSTIIRVINNTNSTIAANTAVRVTGFQVVEEIPVSNIAIASNDDEDTMPAVGLTQDNLGPGDIGTVRMHGLVGGFNTSAQTGNDEVYVGVNGAVTYTDPMNSGGISQQIGTVARVSFTDGQILLLPSEVKAPHAITHYEGGTDEIDHGSIIGLEDDDHEQYVLVNGRRVITGDLTIDADLTVNDNTHIVGDLQVDGDSNIGLVPKYISTELTVDTGFSAALINIFATTNVSTFVSSGITHSTSNGTFTVDTTGVYEIIFLGRLEGVSNLADVFRIRKNVSTTPVTLYDASGQVFVHSSVDPVDRLIVFQVSLTAGDALQCEIQEVTSSGINVHASSTFNMKRIA